MRHDFVNSPTWKLIRSTCGLPDWQVIGIVESLRNFAIHNAKDGNIGYVDNRSIAVSIGYPPDEIDALIDQLCEAGFLVQGIENRLVIADWDTYHAPDFIRRKKRLTGNDREKLSNVTERNVTERKKKNTKKKNIGEDDPQFCAFWESYPNKKVGRTKTFEKWQRIDPDPQLFTEIMAGLSRWKSSRDWKKDHGEFIPLATTWLNQSRWEAEGLENAGVEPRSVSEFEIVPEPETE